MREIKFRAWCESSCGYEYITDLYWFEENLVHDFSGDGTYDKYVFEQFTGLKDDKEDDIYENDIIDVDYGDTVVRGVMKWHNDASFMIETISDSWKPDGYCSMIKIGNIHENPELLK